MGLFDYLFGLTGRATRLHWWIGQVVSIGLSIAAGVWAGLRIEPFLRFDLAQLSREQTIDILRNLGPALALVWIAAFIALSVTVRRFHDRDKSGWWVIAPALPLAILLAAGIEPWALAAAGLLTTVISIWQLVELGCLAGSPGWNDYGTEYAGRMRHLDREIAAMHRRAVIMHAEPQMVEGRAVFGRR
jgi:uncharacterized membrane protein YhaH (DUF805 family)